jgi:hypothetical protein
MSWTLEPHIVLSLALRVLHLLLIIVAFSFPRHTVLERTWVVISRQIASLTSTKG